MPPTACGRTAVRWSALLVFLRCLHQLPLATGQPQTTPPSAFQNWHSGLEDFFHEVDADGNGQIEPTEAARYIGKSFDPGDYSGEELGRAVEYMKANLDSSDVDYTISEGEVVNHLRSLQKGHRVAEWVKHAVGLSQYSQAFKDNSITALDFPMLVKDGGLTLEQDLGITSKLHQQQILRAIKRVILGLGSPPSAPTNLTCRAIACGALEVAWAAPEQPGHPPFHKYKLERAAVDGLEAKGVAAPPLAAWVTAHGELDDEDTQWVDAGLEAGAYQYRLVAWNAYGWSPDTPSPMCSTTDAPGPCGACPGGADCGPIANAAAALGQLFDPGPPRARGWGAPLWVALLVAVASATLYLVAGRPMGTSRLVGLSQVAQTLASLAAPRGEQGLGLAGQRSEDGIPGPLNQANLAGPSPILQHGAGSDPGMRALLRNISGRSVTSEPMGGAGEGVRGVGLEASPPGAGLAALRRGSRSARRLHGSGSSPTLASADGQVDGEPTDRSALDRAWERSRGQGWDGSEDGSIADHNSEGDVELSPHGADRNRCAFPGCHRRFHRLRLADVKHALRRHYCSVCQGVFCVRHTRFSPHGMFGSCGLDSKCVCELCFRTLSRSTQERLDKVNKLPRKEDGAPRAGEDSPAAEARRGSRRGVLGGLFMPAPAAPLATQPQAGPTPPPVHPPPAASNSFRRRASSASAAPAPVPEQEVVPTDARLANAQAQGPGGDPLRGGPEFRVNGQRDARGNWNYVLAVVRSMFRFKDAGRQYSQRLDS